MKAGWNDTGPRGAFPRDIARTGRHNPFARALAESREHDRRLLLPSLWSRRVLGRPLTTLP